MCVTMIDPATSWSGIAEFLISQPSELDIPMGTKGQKGKDKHNQNKELYYDKSSATVSMLVNRTWLVDTHVVSISFMTMEVNSNFTS